MNAPQASAPAQSAEPPATNVRILILAANPLSTSAHRLEVESRSILEKIWSSELSASFEVMQHHAVRVSDLQSHLLRRRPHIVHFSGHGNEAGEILLEDGAGGPKALPPAGLQRLFKILQDDIRCVVLISGFSGTQASGIAESIDCVVGMSNTIGDEAAVAFAASFYQALGYGRSVKKAFDLGCNEILLEGHCGEQDIPSLICRLGVDPEKIYLAGEKAVPRLKRTGSAGVESHASVSGSGSTNDLLRFAGISVPDELAMRWNAVRSRVLTTVTIVATILLLAAAVYWILKLRQVQTGSGTGSATTQSSPGTSQSSNNVSTPLTDGRFEVKAHARFVKQFVVATTNVRVTGEFQCLGGKGNDVEFFIMDRQGMEDWDQGNTYKSLYESGKVSGAKDINIALRPGTYYLIFNNDFSIWSKKTIIANLHLES